MRFTSNSICTITLTAVATLTASLQPFTSNDVQAEDNWPCEVLLCLSNPAGPTAVGQCVPPIARLFEHLSAGRKFPICAARGTNFSNVERGYEPFEDCTNGRTLVTQDANGSSESAFCHKRVSTQEYFGGSTVTAANLEPGDSFVYQSGNREADTSQIVGVNDDEPAKRRRYPNFLTYSVPASGQKTVWF